MEVFTAGLAVAISAGDFHTCVLLEGGVVKCWGKGEYGRLGTGSTEDQGDEPGEMGDNLVSVDLGVGQVATAIAAGVSHTCALLDSGNVKCWGDNDPGSLGLGDLENRGDEPGEMGASLLAVDLGLSRTALKAYVNK